MVEESNRAVRLAAASPCRPSHGASMASRCGRGMRLALFRQPSRSDWIHAAQHVSFFGSALLFWWSLVLFAPGPRATELAVLYLFTTAMHTSILGALLTFARTVWYPAYSPTAPQWGLSALEDQQIGGLIMWVPGGLVYLGAASVLFAAGSAEAASVAAAEPPMRLSWLHRCARASLRLLRQPSPRRSRAAMPPEARRRSARYGCGTCHTIPPLNNAHGLVGPPLTGHSRPPVYCRHASKYARRTWNTGSAILSRSIRTPPCRILGVSSQDAIDIAAYLYSTK